MQNENDPLGAMIRTLGFSSEGLLLEARYIVSLKSNHLEWTLHYQVYGYKLESAVGSTAYIKEYLNSPSLFVPTYSLHTRFKRRA